MRIMTYKIAIYKNIIMSDNGRHKTLDRSATLFDV